MANITCRVADTGRLLGMEVSLQNLNQPSHAQNYLTGYTNLEGRVNYWAFMGKDKQFIASREDQISVWRLKFYIGKYYGLPKGIHQKVVTDIRVERYDNCCIVLEAGHYGYKTYREVSSETQELSEVLQRDVFFKWHDLMHETSHFSEAQLQILRLYLANEGPRAQHFSDVIANQLNVDKNEVFTWFSRKMGISKTWQPASRSGSQFKPVICPADSGAGSFRTINHSEVDCNRFRITKERSPSCEDSITVPTPMKLGRRGEKSKKNKHQQRGIDQGTVKWNLRSGNKRSILTLKARKG